jgi:hypothetical protein
MRVRRDITCARGGGLRSFPGGVNSLSRKGYGGQEVKRQKVDFYICAEEKLGDPWFIMCWARIWSAA